MKISLFRKGSFEVEELTDDQCGYVGQTKYGYEVTLFGSSLDLDSHGFLVDHGVIEQYFSELTRIESGERGACAAVTALIAICKNRGFSPSFVTVKISPSDAVSFVASI